MWGLWWTKRHWDRFSPSTSVSPANHSTKFSIIIITRGLHNRPISGRSAEWTQLNSTTHYTNLKKIMIGTRRRTDPVLLCPPQTPHAYPDANPGCRGGYPASNRLTYGTAFHKICRCFCFMFTVFLYSHQNPLSTPLSLLACYMNHQCTSPLLDQPNTFWRIVQIMKLLIT
jgi:hypothetical protein